VIGTDWTNWLVVLGRLHPMVLHVPIALVLVLAMVELLGVLVRRPFPRAPLLVLLWCNAVFAGITAASGLQLAQEGGYDQELLTLHQVLGVGSAGACVLLALLASVFRHRAVYRWALLLALVLILPAGHFGASMTHGKDFLTGPLQRALEGAPPKPPRPGPVDGAGDGGGDGGGDPVAAARVSYVRDVAPLLEKYCIKCHGEEKQKGELRFDSPAAIRKGGENGAVLVAGAPDTSAMIVRLRLPEDDEDRMPPEGKPQPIAAEIDLLVRWIAEGAAFDGAGAAPPAPAPAPPAEAPKEPVGPPAGRGQQARGTAAPAAGPAALRALHDALVHAAPVAQDATLLRVDFAAIATSVDDAMAQRLLGPVAGEVAELSLARSKVTDATLPLLGTMTRLRRLDLRGTRVTAAGLVHLRGLGELRELVLAQTPLLDPVLDAIAALPALERVYLWGAGLGPEALARLRERQGLVVDAGDRHPSAALETEPEVTLGRPEAGAAPAAAPPVNALCPVSGRPVDPAVTVVHEGKVVAFCCPDCPARFQADPAKYPVRE
jgi:uncharacterized membrane protein